MNDDIIDRNLDDQEATLAADLDHEREAVEQIPENVRRVLTDMAGRVYEAIDILELVAGQLRTDCAPCGSAVDGVLRILRPVAEIGDQIALTRAAQQLTD